MWQVAGARTATAKTDLDRAYLGEAQLLLSSSTSRHMPPAICQHALSSRPPDNPASPETQTTYVKKGMGCTSFRSGSFSRTVSACLFFRSPRASSMMACVSAALTDTSWIDMSLIACKTGRNYNVTKLEPKL